MLNVPFIAQISLVSASTESVFGNDVSQMIMHAGPMVKFVLGVLLFFSTVSWAIIFVKIRFFRNAKKETEKVLEVFWEGRGLKNMHGACKDLAFSPVARLFRAGYAELHRMKKLKSSDREAVGTGKPLLTTKYIVANLERSLKRAEVDQINRMERALGFLATTGNTAPFIGLFGTVWGIMDSFRGIGLKGAANLAVVAPGISEALIATAVGLAAAIPAVIAFNYFNQRISSLRAEIDIFKSDFMVMIEQQFFADFAAETRKKTK